MVRTWHAYVQMVVIANMSPENQINDSGSEIALFAMQIA